MSVERWESDCDWAKVAINPSPADVDYPEDAFECIETHEEEDTPVTVEDRTGKSIIFYVPGEEGEEFNPDASIAVGKSVVVDPASYA